VAQGKLRSAVPADFDQTSVDGPVEGWTGLDRLEPDSSGTAKVSPEQEAPPTPRHAAVRRKPRVRIGAAGRALAAWPQRPTGRLAVPGLLIIAMVVASVVLGGILIPGLPGRTHHAFALLDTAAPDADSAQVPGEVPGADQGEANGAIPQNNTATQQPGGSTKPSDLATWAAPLAGKLGIPLPAMQAYGYAELALAAAQPACQLRWTTLAGIGKVESAHGTDHAALAPDGKALPPIIGSPLDGLGGRAAVPDTDGGKLDSDRTWDRAVGPMQFIPSTWNQYAADADGDGVTDINDINDAALAAARYLCASNRNLSVAGEWWAAILSYNAVRVYAQDVYTAANDYGLRSH
jgi:Transglycosylase SLT domain